MIRVRFRTNMIDYRPAVWPIKHPYWCTGYGENEDGSENCILVAYADDVEEIKTNWPEAYDIDVIEKDLSEYTFTSRFQKPEWFAKQESKA